ncbi:MAG: hypothetical protein AAFX94_15485 [Myxococcota bacterium]
MRRALIVVSLLLIAPDAGAQDDDGLGLEVDVPVRVVILPLRGRPDKRTEEARQFEQTLHTARSATSLVRIETLEGLPTQNRREVRKKQRVKRCKARVDCLARWGRRFRLRELILPQVKPSADGALEVLISVIDVRSAAVERRAIFTTTPERAVVDIKANYELIFGVPPDPEVGFDSELVPEPEPELPPEPEPRPAEPVAEASDPEETEPVAVAPTADVPPAISVPAAPAVVRRQDTLRTGNETDGGEISTLAWVGYGSLAVGLTAAAVGGFLVDQGQSTAEETDPSLSQVAARSQLDDASAQVDQGNVLLLVGGGVALVGLGSLLVESILGDEDEATVTPIVGPGRVGAVVRW